MRQRHVERGRTEKPDTENVSTTNLTASDKWGNVAEYTLTIEQTGGSGIVVPGRGFLLNNELTDFTAVYDPADPNRIEGGKRPRSSISPTIVLDDGKPFLALGSPGGSTIITTVLQMLFNRIDRGMTLPAGDRRAARLAAQHRRRDGRAGVHRRLRRAAGGPTATRSRCPGAPGTSASEIGAATGDRVPRRRPGDRGLRAGTAGRWVRARRTAGAVGLGEGAIYHGTVVTGPFPSQISLGKGMSTTGPW